MSHTLHEASVLRVQRCELAVPGSNPNMFEKAMKSGVDFVFLTLKMLSLQTIRYKPEEILSRLLTI